MTNTNTTRLALLIEARELSRTGKGRVIREAAGLSQGDVARAAGVAPATVSRWESRERKPTGEAAIRWTRVLRLVGQPRRAKEQSTT